MCFQRLNNKHWACMGLHLVIYVMVLAWQFCETSNTGSTGLSLTFWSALGTPFFLIGLPVQPQDEYFLPCLIVSGFSCLFGCSLLEAFSFVKRRCRSGGSGREQRWWGDLKGL